MFWSKAADREMGSSDKRVKGLHLKNNKVKQRHRGGKTSLKESKSSIVHRNIISVDLAVGV